ncbi:hypothetical protein INS49_006864 [Diaporthe citri]|uniref:uncharacterized protein n=1 Tax=Diaporthe citri TaxID=83186 RepID=UPI001C7EB074|nr:uncharacterized protein INS49_006864 [Diaporthe citri]KAG6365255.1 hypothetical protein INS49_006864 [Diaporthe citri]
MEWLTSDRILRDQDLRTLKFSRMRSLTNACVTAQSLESDEEWEQWLENEEEMRSKKSPDGITLLFCGRAKPRFPGMEVAYLPFSKDICKRVASVLQIYGSISRVINRSARATFVAQRTTQSHKSSPVLLYNCRSSDNWENDLALSVTYSPEHKATQAVLYGCDDDTRDKIHQRLSRSACAVHHPLTLPLIFAEHERDRLFGKVDPLVTKLVERALSISKPSAFTESMQKTFQSSAAGGNPAREESPEELMKMWLGVSALRRGLEAWKAQLLKMQSHCRTMKFEEPSPGNHTQRQIDELRELAETGERIEQRLVELIGEFDEKIGDCVTVTDGMVLATQLEWNNIGQADARTNVDISRYNLGIAQATHSDSKQMRSIAMLTMIFLPATFVAWTAKLTFD